MRSQLAVMFLFFLTVSATANEASYSSLLAKHVHAGRVDYPKLCKDARLGEYISQFANSDPAALSNRNDQLAFWINAYNAYTLKAICDHYPVKSINDLNKGGLILGTVLHTTIWDKDFVVIHKKQITLNQIEHKIIRPQFKDPRAHFALVCASKSCPPLRPEAFEGLKLDQQLDDQARTFLSDPARNRFDVENHKAQISKIFDWYGKDFGHNDGEILMFLSRFLASEIANSIRSHPENWKIEYQNYDWTLNE